MTSQTGARVAWTEDGGGSRPHEDNTVDRVALLLFDRRRGRPHTAITLIFRVA